MFSKHLKQIRLENGLSQAQMARKLGLTQGAVSQWESGRTRPDAEQLVQISKLFQVPLDYFASESPGRDLDGVVEMRRRAVPVVGEIACGTPILAQQNIESYIDTPDGTRADFALRCKGTSMEPLFRDGDLVLIRQQEDADDGKIAAVLIGNEATLKRVHRIQDGIMLLPENTADFAPLVYQGEQAASVRIVGVAIGFVRMI